MPLMKSGSKKAFKKNVATEMDEHPDKKAQDLAIAYSIQRQNKGKKKMALGGATESNPSTSVSPHEDKMVAEHEHTNECWVDGKCMYAEGGEISAKSEKRPMPDDEFNDKDEAMRQKKGPSKAPEWIDPKASHEAEGSMSRKQRGPEWDSDKEQTADEGNDDLGLDMYAEGGDINFHDEPEANIDSHYDSIADAIMAKRKMRKMMADGGEVDLEANSEESPNFEDDASFEANGKEQYDDGQISPQPRDSNMKSVVLDSDEHDMISRIRAKMKAKRGE